MPENKSNLLKEIQSELIQYGFNYINQNDIQFIYNDKVESGKLEDVVSLINKYIKNYEKTLFDYTNKFIENLKIIHPKEESIILDSSITNIFLYNIYNVYDMYCVFEDEEFINLRDKIKQLFFRDICSYSYNQINSFIDNKNMCDITFRNILKLVYIKKMLKYVNNLSKKNIDVLSYGVSGPWANLDLPFQERKWNWWTEDENFRERDRDLRMQRRYEMGLENYNNDGSVGDGYYWRELRNQPEAWSDWAEQSPYPRRTLLWGS